MVSNTVSTSGEHAKSPRAKNLAASLPFRMHVHAQPAGLGPLEGAIHSMLAGKRNRQGNGREWFRVSLADAIHAVAVAAAAHI